MHVCQEKRLKPFLPLMPLPEYVIVFFHRVLYIGYETLTSKSTWLAIASFFQSTKYKIVRVFQVLKWGIYVHKGLQNSVFNSRSTYPVFVELKKMPGEIWFPDFKLLLFNFFKTYFTYHVFAK